MIEAILKKEVASNTNVIDLDLGAFLISADVKSAYEMLGTLIGTLPAIENELEKCYLNKNYSDLVKITHKLHGSLCYCGAPRLKNVMKSFELALDVRDVVKIDQIYIQVRTEINNLYVTYQQLLVPI